MFKLVSGNVGGFVYQDDRHRGDRQVISQRQIGVDFLGCIGNRTQDIACKNGQTNLVADGLMDHILIAEGFSNQYTS